MRLRQRIEKRQQQEQELSTRRMQKGACVQVEVKTKDGMRTNFDEARAHSIAESIRAGKGATREQFKQRLHAKIVEQRGLQQNKIAACMPNQRIHEEKFDGEQADASRDGMSQRRNAGIKATLGIRSTSTSLAVQRLLRVGKLTETS
jgi:hypothetical protein